MFGVAVQRGSRFIQQHDASSSEQTPGNGYSLGLSFTESCSGLPTDGVQSIRKFHDEFSGSIVQGAGHFFFRGVRFSEHQIFPYRSAYEGIALRDIDEIASRHCSCRDFFLIVVQCDTAAVRTELRQYEPYQCAFADTRLTDDFRTAARREIL